MRRMGLLLLLAAALAAGSTQLAQADTWVFSLLPPDGSIDGPPGSTIGWGYTITNQSPTQWLVLSGVAATDPFQNATPDASIFDFPVLAPMTTVSLAYDATTPAGLFQLTWDLTAPIGFANTGTITLSADWYSGDPFAADPEVPGSFVMTAGDASATYSATVTAVPEPSTLLLVFSGLGTIALLRRGTVA